MKNLKSILLGAVASICLYACNSDDSENTNGSLTLKFDHSVEVGETVTDGEGNTVTVDKLRYLITDVVLVNDDGTETEIENNVAATLIDLADADNGVVYKEISEVPAGTITGLKFKVGVSEEIHSQGLEAQEALYNLALTTDEDEADMFWQWASGYIFVMFEGSYESAHDDAHIEETEEAAEVHHHAINTNVAFLHGDTDTEETTEGTTETETTAAFQSHIGNQTIEGVRTDRAMEVTIGFHGEEINYTGTDASIHLAVDVEALLEGIDVSTFENIHTFSESIPTNVEGGSVFSFDHQH